jgi:hypothetical protein
MYLMGTEALVAGCDQMRSLKPTMQFEMAGLENGANRNREFAFAWPQRHNPARPPLTGVILSKPPPRGQTFGNTIALSLAIAAASL